MGLKASLEATILGTWTYVKTREMPPASADICPHMNARIRYSSLSDDDVIPPPVPLLSNARRVYVLAAVSGEPDTPAAALQASIVSHCDQTS